MTPISGHPCRWSDHLELMGPHAAHMLEMIHNGACCRHRASGSKRFTTSRSGARRVVAKVSGSKVADDTTRHTFRRQAVPSGCSDCGQRAGMRVNWL